MRDSNRGELRRAPAVWSIRDPSQRCVSLERNEPARLQADAAVGKDLYAAMSAAFGAERVSLTALGPIIEQDDNAHPGRLAQFWDATGAVGGAP